MKSVFPQYRKYVGLDIWFKIVSEDHFVEIKKVGDKFVLTDIVAEQYPEKLRIQDMLSCLEGRWENIDSEMFEKLTQ